jgi:hypothetical protein
MDRGAHGTSPAGAENDAAPAINLNSASETTDFTDEHG